MTLRHRSPALFAIVALALGLLMVPGASIAKSPNAAVVIRSNTCTLLDASGQVISGTKLHAVTNRKRGKATCRASGVANDTGKAVRLNFANTGVTCVLGSLSTQRWKETISASGRAKLTCHFNVS
jgi:hypothetical protein